MNPLSVRLGIIALLGVTLSAEPADPGAPPVTLTPDMKRALLEKAENWGVPQPETSSKLLKIWAFKSNSRNIYLLGFVEPGYPDRALVGFDYLDLTGLPDPQGVPDPQQLSLDDISPTSPFAVPHELNFGLITGIQLIRRGNEQLGWALIEKSLGEEAGHSRSPFLSPAGEDPVLMLARSCLAAALNEITSPAPDFSKIKQRIERLLADRPELRSGATDQVLGGLEANVNHQPSPRGSIESIIDDYLLCRGKSGLFAFRTEGFAPAERALILNGFEAVPALLKQRRAGRFSNHLMQGFNNIPNRPMKAGEVIDAYLRRLANDGFGCSWLDVQWGVTPEEEQEEEEKAVRQWWKKASEMGEESYVREHTVILNQEAGATLSDVLLFLAQERYPRLLPDIYESLLGTSCPSWQVGEALLQTKTLPLDEKVRLYQAAIATNHEAHRNSALRHLQDLSPALADSHLARLLKLAPSSPAGEYWSDPDANLGRLVSRSIAPGVWEAFHTLIDRADLGMRMELINYLVPAPDAPAEIQRSYHEIYDRFQDDPVVRDITTNDRFSGPGAGFPHRRIRMRDFIHVHWARWLKLEFKEPEPGAPETEWQAYREAVALAVQRSRAQKRQWGRI